MRDSVRIGHEQLEMDGAVLLQYLAFCRLWITKVHHFVEQLVDNDKIIAYTLLFQLFEIFREDFHDLV